jgi:SlyX protein
MLDWAGPAADEESPMPEPPRDAHRLTELEIALAHAERTIEELSEIVRAQVVRIEALERRWTLLATRVAAAEEGAEPATVDRPPPHW